ncbi:uncharacterized protein BDV14DRAFT_195371 [Aspergillus stella-maris]|uniref:uncharacterized protein n=1 Tax=Aspergillus stella-maris TaxID=1810926 RepID=UPI003CCE1A3A
MTKFTPRIHALTTRFENGCPKKLLETRTYGVATCVVRTKKDFWTDQSDEQSRSIALVQNLARTLNYCEITHYHISAGLRTTAMYVPPDQRTWEVSLFLGKTGMSDGDLSLARQLVLSHVYPFQPTTTQEKTFDEYSTSPETWKYHIENAQNVQHKTQFAVWDGKPYLIQKDGRVDYEVLEEYQFAREGEGRPKSPLGRGREKVGRAFNMLGMSAKRKSVEGDVMQEVLGKLVQSTSRSGCEDEPAERVISATGCAGSGYRYR